MRWPQYRSVAIQPSSRAHLHVGGMLQFMSNINQPSLPIPFLFCSSVSVFMVHEFSRQLSYLTHSFILRKEEAPVCVACNAVITVKHILIECADLLEIRKKYFEEKSLYSLFRSVIPEAIFGFLREIGVFYKI